MRLNLNIHPEVQTALAENSAVVALESTLITHGFPAPDNLKIAQAIEATVRQQGAVPATIALLEGQIHVGLTLDQLEYLGTTSTVRKCSRRDLPIAVARRENGSTTVAATMIIARSAGIKLFATGGIGGVHRGQPFDESADLRELSQTAVTVVCAGAKAILDLSLTLEVLETRGVPVIGYQTDELPAFYSRQSGLMLDMRVDTPQEMARLIKVHDEMEIESGLLVTVPVPAKDEWPAAEAQLVIDRAIADAAVNGVVGKAVTPYLLERVSDLSGQQSKKANIALLLNNAQVAAQIAQALVA
ncbi:MAG: pseudouridine-5'-phosphate glycosidase [Anaerolineae bacterium]|nr:pseudouridine-5'-phosphate glycosidase [Anaerolineae bacterium]